MIDEPIEPEVQELIAAGREGLGPDAATIARLRTRIDDAIATSPSVPVRSLAPKLVVVAALTGLGIGSYVAGTRVTQEPVAPLVATGELEAASTPDVALVAADTISPIRAATEPVARARARKDPTRALVVENPAPRSPEASPESSPEAVATRSVGGISLAREIELIDRAALAMRRADASTALETLRVYERETAGLGQLAQDAAALGVEIVCAGGDQRARDELARFEQRWPRSAHLRRLTAVCGTANRRE